MSRLEDRLRDAYRDEAGAVTPDSVAGLGAAIAARSKASHPGSPRRWARWLTPLAAAAAVAVIIVVAAVAVPRDPGPSRPAATTGGSLPGAPTFLIDETSAASPLLVLNATTGARVAQVTVPGTSSSGNDRKTVTSVTTWNGRDYLVAEYAESCRSWLYRFALDSAGQPSALTPFAALPTVRGELYSLSVSRDGQLVGFASNTCQGANRHYVGVTNARTGHTTRWTIPSGNTVDDVSLTADGKQLCYNLNAPPALARVIPTSAAAGSAADLGRTVARGPSATSSSFAAISADGSKVYFSYSIQAFSPAATTSQIRVADVATGHSRLVYTPAVLPGLIASAPGARYLILQAQGQPTRRVRLDTATGKATDLPAGWAPPGIFYW